MVNSRIILWKPIYTIPYILKKVLNAYHGRHITRESYDTWWFVDNTQQKRYHLTTGRIERELMAEAYNTKWSLGFGHLGVDTTLPSLTANLFASYD